MEGVMRCSANYVPLTPISFLERSAVVYGDRVSLVYGDVQYTWRETRERCTRLASALAHLGISRGDVVKVFSCFLIFLIDFAANGFIALLFIWTIFVILF
jgi:acyl-CoA synthetase (AMP-forming)/AMP-acid ligase II